MTKLVVILGFLVAFAAGLTVGLATRTNGLASPAAPNGPTTRPRGMQGFLVSELGLTPQQQEQLRKIWSAPPGPHEFGERREQLRRERDEAILALVSPADRAKYDAAQKNYKDQIEAADREMRSSFESKVSRTKEILTPDQRAKYEEILKRHQSDRGPRGRGGAVPPEPGRRDDLRATSRPAATRAMQP